MELYHDFQIKDHYYWSGPCPEFVTTDAPKPEPKPVPVKVAKPVKPIYKAYTVREKDGTVTTWSARINPEPVIIDGYMV